MSIHVWGTDYRRSAPDLRARLYVSPDKRITALEALRSLGFQDMIYLHTCNRIEFYTTAPNHFEDYRERFQALLDYFGLSPEVYYQGYHLESKTALRHLLRVSCSLESQLIGETQILGQIKQALFWTQENSLPLTAQLRKSFDLAISLGKKVREETDLGRYSLSYPRLVLQKLLERDENFSGRYVLVGTSPIIQGLCKELKTRVSSLSQITVVNRTVKNLGSVTAYEGLTCLSLDKFMEDSERAYDYLMTATSSPEEIFRDDYFQGLRHKPQLVFDLAEPYDVAESICSSIELLRLISLKGVSDINLEKRKQASQQVSTMIARSMEKFFFDEKADPILKDFNQVQPKVNEIWDEFMKHLETLSLTPEELRKTLNLAVSCFKKQTHLNRDHLKEILKQKKPDSLRALEG